MLYKKMVSNEERGYSIPTSCKSVNQNFHITQNLQLSQRHAKILTCWHGWCGQICDKFLSLLFLVFDFFVSHRDLTGDRTPPKTPST